MKILNIDIDNYGTLEDFHINFSENPYIIIEENGWGKSTLASFIRVMFFGFEDESKKKLEERERYRYKPWNNGTYGGSISFEVGGKSYRLDRTFGSKVADDESKLVDITTRKEVSDYDLNTLGEQIFGINKDAYIRSLFIGQGNIEVRNDKDNIEDSITAKIGNLTEATDDVNNYEVVMNKLKTSSYALKSGNKKGEINLLNATRAQYVAELNRTDVVEADIEQHENTIEAMSAELENYKRRLLSLNKEYELAGMLDAYREKENNLKQLCEEIDKTEAQLKKIKEFFGKRIPDKEEINEITEAVKKAHELKSRTEQTANQLHGVSQDLQTGDLPAREVMDSLMTSIRKREECDDRIREAQSQYSHSKDMLDMKKDMELREWRRDQQKAEDDYEQALKAVQESVKSSWRMSVIVGIIIALISLVALLAVGPLGILGVLIGLIVIIVASLSRKSKEAKDKEQITKVAIRPQPDFSEADKDLERIAELIATHKDKYAHYDEQIKSFCDKYQLADDELLENNMLKLQSRLSEMSKNTELMADYEKQKADYEKLEEQIRGWFFETGITASKDWTDTIFDARHNLDDLKELTSKLEELMDRKADYNIEKNFTEEEISSVRPIEDIKADREQTDNATNQLREVLDERKDELDALFEQKKELEETRANLLVIDDKLEECEHKYDIISKTMGYLEKAKEQLSARYMDPIEDAFTKYYSYITTQYLDKYELDADINISRQEMGHRRSKNSLSQGYKDLVDISLRMALIDVMYKDEKPWIVLDDPFVNLDTEKLAQVKDFIEEISKEYQVIYFTCHESRA